MLATLTNVVMESLQCACQVAMILFLRLTHAVKRSRTASVLFVILFRLSTWQCFLLSHKSTSKNFSFVMYADEWRGMDQEWVGFSYKWRLGVGGISLLNFCNAYSSLHENNHCPRTRACVCACVHVCMCACVCACVRVCVCVHAWVHASIWVLSLSVSFSLSHSLCFCSTANCPVILLPWTKKTATTIMHKIRTLFLSWYIEKSSLIALRCAAMREVAASRATVPIFWSCWYCVIRTVFWFYA